MRWKNVLRTWAAGDRIRTSPRDGKLLRLPVGACVRWGGVAAQITAREVGECAGGAAAVVYACRAADGAFCLRVTLRGAGPPRLEILRAGVVRPLGRHEVEVYG